MEQGGGAGGVSPCTVGASPWCLCSYAGWVTFTVRALSLADCWSESSWCDLGSFCHHVKVSLLQTPDSELSVEVSGGND